MFATIIRVFDRIGTHTRNSETIVSSLERSFGDAIFKIQNHIVLSIAYECPSHRIRGNIAIAISEGPSYTLSIDRVIYIHRESWCDIHNRSSGGTNARDRDIHSLFTGYCSRCIVDCLRCSISDGDWIFGKSSTPQSEFERCDRIESCDLLATWILDLYEYWNRITSYSRFSCSFEDDLSARIDSDISRSSYRIIDDGLYLECSCG